MGGVKLIGLARACCTASVLCMESSLRQGGWLRLCTWVRRAVQPAHTTELQQHVVHAGVHQMFSSGR